MQKRTKAVLIGSGVVVALALGVVAFAPTVYRSLFPASQVEPPKLQAEDTTLRSMSDEELDPAAISGTWKLASGSHVGYRVDEKLQGENVTVVGSTERVSGSIDIDGLTLTNANITVDVASIETDSTGRDNYFRDTTMRADTYPEATFVLTHPASIAEAPQAGEIISLQLTGELTMAGTTRTVTMTAQARSDGSTAEIVGQIPVTFADYGITAPSLGGFVTVEGSGLIEFDLQAVLDSAE